MKGKNGIPAEYLARTRVRVINRDVLVFTFFLILSFVLWYLISLGKEIEAGIKLPVGFTNLPIDRALSDDKLSQLTLFMKGSGYSILKLKIKGEGNPVLIDLSKANYKRVAGSNKLDYFILTSLLAKSLTIQLRSDCEITSIKPDTLFFTLEKVSNK